MTKSEMIYWIKFVEITQKRSVLRKMRFKKNNSINRFIKFLNNNKREMLSDR